MSRNAICQKEFIRGSVSRYEQILSFLFFVILFIGLYELGVGGFQCLDVLKEESSYLSVTGTFRNSGPYSNFVAIVLPLAYYHVSCVKKWHYWNICKKTLAVASILYVLLSLFVLPICMGRTSWIATLLGCGAVAFCTMCNYGKCRKNVILLLVVIVCSSIACLFFGYKVKKDSADGRLFIWKITATVISETFPRGVGNGLFEGAYGNAQEDYFRKGKGKEHEIYVAGAPDYAYNEYLQIIAEQGAVELFVIFFRVGVRFPKVKFFYFLCKNAIGW